MAETGNGYFRYKNGYTVVVNAVAKHPTLSIKAKGLYLAIQANITDPNNPFSKRELINMLPEGEKAIHNAWTELKEAGFLKIHVHLYGFRKCEVEYDLLNEEVFGPHTFYYNSKGELIETNETSNKNIQNIAE